MKGQITQFSAQQGQGIILGEDGRSYTFASNQWGNANAPRAGEEVSFGVDPQGQAIGIQTAFAINPQVNVANQTTTPLNPYQAPQHLGGQVSHYSNDVNAIWAEEENYGFMDWVKKCLRNYANFNGRARRKEYWFFYLFYTIIYLVASFIDGVIGTKGVIAGLVSLALILPNFAVAARRLHDVNRSGWWQLVVFVPFIIFIVMLVTMLASGSGGLAQAGIGLILTFIILAIVSILLLVWYCTDTKPETNQWGAPARRV